jgi:ElaB/YqjD/DUF883 family membrane-anchored ribosome-binding protein
MSLPQSPWRISPMPRNQIDSQKDTRHEAHSGVLQSLGASWEHPLSDAGHVIQKAAGDLSHAANSLADAARRQSGALARRARREVREHPVRTAAAATVLAVGVGALIAMAVSKNSRKPHAEL